MKTKAKVAWAAAVISLAVSGYGQESAQPAVPIVPRGDGTGSAIPSHNAGKGDASGSATGSTSASGAGEKSSPVRQSDLPQASVADRSREAARERVGTIDENPADRPTAQVDSGPAVMNTTDFARELRTASYAARQALLDGLDVRLSGHQRELDEVRQSAPTLTGDARRTYRQALRELKDRRGALHQALRAARKAQPAAWETHRTALADAFEAYSVALTRLEVTAPRHTMTAGERVTGVR